MKRKKKKVVKRKAPKAKRKTATKKNAPKKSLVKRKAPAKSRKLEIPNLVKGKWVIATDQGILKMDDSFSGHAVTLTQHDINTGIRFFRAYEEACQYLAAAESISVEGDPIMLAEVKPATHFFDTSYEFDFVDGTTKLLACVTPHEVGESYREATKLAKQDLKSEISEGKAELKAYRTAMKNEIAAMQKRHKETESQLVMCIANCEKELRDFEQRWG